MLISDESIVGYKEAFFDDETSCLCLVMDFMDDGDLYQKIVRYQKAGKLIPEKTVWEIFLPIVKALRVLHSKNILHRDLKSANIFLQKDAPAKLGDLNVSKVAKKGLLYTQTGTPYYASPEVWKDLPYDSKSDIWSLGCVLYEMITL
jgi:NIMA (never in mitosis gene a)-related kinase